jgi:hypothetical protein
MAIQTLDAKPLTVDEVVALYEMADKGPLGCDCHGNPSVCTCSTIGRLCIEWMKSNGYNPQPASTLSSTDRCEGK